MRADGRTGRYAGGWLPAWRPDVVFRQTDILRCASGLTGGTAMRRVTYIGDGSHGGNHGGGYGGLSQSVNCSQ